MRIALTAPLPVPPQCTTLDPIAWSNGRAASTPSEGPPTCRLNRLGIVTYNYSSSLMQASPDIAINLEPASTLTLRIWSWQFLHKTCIWHFGQPVHFIHKSSQTASKVDFWMHNQTKPVRWTTYPKCLTWHSYKSRYLQPLWLVHLIMTIFHRIDF
jgi:hypothetical protein